MAAAAAAAAMRLLHGSGGKFGGLFSPSTSTRRMWFSSGKALSDEETKIFLSQFEEFVKRAEAFSTQDAFAELVKQMSSLLNSVAIKNGIMYPSELANLVATFVPVQGTYVPQNSKVVVVDLAKRVKLLEDRKRREASVVFGVLTVFLGTVCYAPFSYHKLEQAEASLSTRVAMLEGKQRETQGESGTGNPSADTAIQSAGDNKKSASTNMVNKKVLGGAVIAATTAGLMFFVFRR
ncbi:hypothetical protein ACP4OV_000638 [Aristida adscensionis]